LDETFPTALARDMIFGTLEHSARGQRYAGRPVNTVDVGRQIVDLLVGSSRQSASDEKLARIEKKLDRLLDRESSNIVPTDDPVGPRDTVKR